MDKKFEKKYHFLEENHWWFKARREIILSMVDKKKRILEIGCSTGILTSKLKNSVGIDISEEAIKKGKERGTKNILVMDGVKTDFSDNEFDIIIASDVLEHVDDKKAIKEWRRIVKPGGEIIIFVPAFQFLWSQHDVKNHHIRRYSKHRLRMILKDFRIERISYWNFFMFFPLSLLRIMQRFSKNKKDQLDKNSAFNNILYSILRFENFLLKHINLPVGVSLFVVATKR